MLIGNIKYYDNQLLYRNATISEDTYNIEIDWIWVESPDGYTSKNIYLIIM